MDCGDVVVTSSAASAVAQERTVAASGAGRRMDARSQPSEELSCFTGGRYHMERLLTRTHTIQRGGKSGRVRDLSH
eukprot:scaffold13291_cov159-Isochrysis_galbana.AAC.3